MPRQQVLQPPAPPEPPVELPPAVTDDHRDDLLQIPWGAIGVGLGGGVALLVVVAVLATVDGVSAVLLGGGLTLRPVTPVTTNKPQDPIAVPPAPTADVTGKLSDGRVYWTWQPTQQAGMHYAVTVRRSGREDLTREVVLSALDVEAVPGRNCATVVRVGPDGRESSGSKAVWRCRDQPPRATDPTTYS